MDKVDVKTINSAQKRSFSGGFNFGREYVRLFVLMFGAMVGVGFISGAEIYQFFARFGKFAWVGIVVFFILIFALVCKILLENTKCKKLVILHKTRHNSSKFTFYNKFNIKEILLFVCVVLVAGAMFSGLKNLILNLLNNNHIFVFCACVLLIFVLLLVGVRGLEKFNYFVLLTLSILVVHILIFGLGDNIKGDFKVQNFQDISFINITLPILFSLMYVFMNIVQVRAISNALSIKFSKLKIVLYSLVFSAILTLIVSIFVLFLHNNSFYATDNMPLLSYFKNLDNKLLLAIFVIGMFLGLISTLLSCLIGVKHTIGKRVESNLTQSFVSVMLGLVLGMIDFSVYVSVLYPIIGVINFFVFVFL